MNDGTTFDRNTLRSTVLLRCILGGIRCGNHSSCNCFRTSVSLPQLQPEASLHQLREDSDGLQDFGDFQERRDQVQLDLHPVARLSPAPGPTVQIFMELATIHWTQSLTTSTASAHPTRSQGWSAPVDLRMRRRHGITANGERWETLSFPSCRAMIPQTKSGAAAMRCPSEPTFQTSRHKINMFSINHVPHTTQTVTRAVFFFFVSNFFFFFFVDLGSLSLFHLRKKSTIRLLPPVIMSEPFITQEPATIEGLAETDIPSIDAIFITRFDTRQGNVLEWCDAVPDLALNNVEFASLPSGLHNTTEDVMYEPRKGRKTEPS